MQVPNDITGITYTSGTLYLVRESADLIRSCGGGDVTVQEWVTITGNIADGVYPDDSDVTFRLALSNINLLYVYTGNISYLHLGFSDFAYTISRAANTQTRLGRNFQTEIISLFMDNCALGHNSTTNYKFDRYNAVYLKNFQFRWTGAGGHMIYPNDDWLRSRISIWENTNWHNDTPSNYWGLSPARWQVYILGTLTQTGFYQNASSNGILDAIKVRRINIRVVDEGGNPVNGAYVFISYTGVDNQRGRLLSDLFTARKTDSTGRPELSGGEYGLNVPNPLNRNELRTLYVPYEQGDVDPLFHDAVALDPAIDIIVVNPTAGAITRVQNAMAADIGTYDTPTDIVLKSPRNIYDHLEG